MIELRKYLDDALAKRRIRSSTSLVEVLILFILKKDDGLRLYIDYRDLNKVTKKNRYLLSLISEILDRLVDIKIFIKLDLKDTYYRIRIKKDDE